MKKYDLNAVLGTCAVLLFGLCVFFCSAVPPPIKEKIPAKKPIQVKEIKDVSVTADPLTKKQRVVVNIRFMPAETKDYEKVVFQCTLRQIFEMPDASKESGKIIKIYEPVKFEYIRKNVRMVRQLAKYIHFPVPVGLEELRESYGKLTFRRNIPVTVSHVKIIAYIDGKEVWAIEEDVRKVEKKDMEKTKRSNMMR